MLNPKVRELLDGFAVAGAPPVYEQTPQDARASTRTLRELIASGPAVGEVVHHVIDGPGGSLSLREYRPADDPRRTIVYLHGGGWVLCGLDDADSVCRSLCLQSAARVISVEYRLAPEAPFPAAFDDTRAAVLWAASTYPSEDGLVVAGDSAGGNLAAVCAVWDAEQSDRMISHQVLVYPVTDHKFDTASYREHDDPTFFVRRRDMEWFFDLYVPEVGRRDDPFVSPLRVANPGQLAPALVVVAEYDVLRDDGLRYADRLRGAGVPVVTSVFDDTVHGFFTLVGLLDGSARAIREIAEFIEAPAAVVAVG